MLIAYSNLDQQICYCQGMNFIAAYFINLFEPVLHDEYDIFIIFYLVIQKFNQFYLPLLPAWNIFQHQLHQYIKKYLPSIDQHFQYLNHYHPQYDALSEWILTLYNIKYYTIIN